MQQKSEIILIIASTLLLFFILILLPLLRRDYTLLITKEKKYQINLLNWSKPNWGKKFLPFYKHIGPLLIVSSKLYTNRCARGCCAWVDIKGEELSSH